MGPVEPPQRKGRLPQHARNKLVDLQNKFDELENLGVSKRPEDINATVEYLNPSFLVKKVTVVTASSPPYSKPQPSLMPDVDTTLRKSHSRSTSLLLTSQMPFTKSLRVATPFRGVRVSIPVQRWVYQALKLPWKNSCVVYLETLFTKELLLRSPTIYIAAPTRQRSYCTTGNECFRPSQSATSNSQRPKPSPTPNLP